MRTKGNSHILIQRNFFDFFDLQYKFPDLIITTVTFGDFPPLGAWLLRETKVEGTQHDRYQSASRRKKEDGVYGAFMAGL